MVSRCSCKEAILPVIVGQHISDGSVIAEVCMQHRAGRMPALLCQPAGCRRFFVSRQDAGASLSAGRMLALLCRTAGCWRSFVGRQDAGAPLSDGRMLALLCQPAGCRRYFVTTERTFSSASLSSPDHRSVVLQSFDTFRCHGIRRPLLLFLDGPPNE